MDELVTRLRVIAEKMPALYTCQEAADALERMALFHAQRTEKADETIAALRAENEGLKDKWRRAVRTAESFNAENERWQNLFEHNRKAADEQEAEISRLRAALETIADENPIHGLTWQGNVARAALTNGEKEK